ncbi:MAG: hypothetical protein MUO27_03645 [Sedimentisphaerales bacterium]|nr:hypothetical protein [Sedimentisphaerales bacterium]
MATGYSVDICRKLQAKFQSFGLHRPMRISRYDADSEMVYNVTGVEKPDTARVHLLAERFVGGGFAGQVYRVKVLDIQNATGPVGGISPGGIYAMKILVPPSGFARLFRNFLYAIGFQGPFQLQVNPAAARAGALWQKFIRRAAKVRFGDEKTVVDVHATFIDEKIGSCGELSEWVDGRTWRLEADDRMDVLKLWRRGLRRAWSSRRTVDANQLGSPEYRAKKQFMADFVKLLHDVGAYELARQYEWSTCKSQPNCLKRKGTEDDPAAGLVAVDFRPGLALLPFLPMSPGDFALIAKGICRGSIVQFDRGDISKLETFMLAHTKQFVDMRGMLDELKADEQIYRNSVPDVTHNDIRLLYDRRLWSTMLDSAVTGWKVRNLVDESWEKKLRTSRLLTLLFLIVGLVPFLGKILRRIWCRLDWRRHYAAMFTSWEYLSRAISGKIIEKTIGWYRVGRLSAHQTIIIAQQPWRFLYHLPFLLLVFAGLHRFLTDADFRKEKLAFVFVRPFRLYFNAALREQWLRDMVAEGQKKHMLTDVDANTILSQINEPYIQKYLVSLVVHLMTLPVTQIVSVSLAIIYYLTHPEMPRAQVWAVAVGIIALFQAIPISPGSLCRGLYVLYLVIKERNFKDYNIAVFLGFFKYIGYLAFPIQMTYHYPVLARFMAGHWATELAHIVPVFGERGALLEHWVFGLFYNWPLTIRRRMGRRAEIRATLAPRYWHVDWLVLLAVLILGAADFLWLRKTGQLPHLGDVWWLAILVPAACGAGATLGCGGAVLWKRIVVATISGMLTGTLYTVISAILSYHKTSFGTSIAAVWAWRTFVFAILAAIGAIITELKLPDPDLNRCKV